jgi:hypothetical protein
MLLRLFVLKSIGKKEYYNYLCASVVANTFGAILALKSLLCLYLLELDLLVL